MSSKKLNQYALVYPYSSNYIFLRFKTLAFWELCFAKNALCILLKNALYHSIFIHAYKRQSNFHLNILFVFSDHASKLLIASFTITLVGIYLMRVYLSYYALRGFRVYSLPTNFNEVSWMFKCEIIDVRFS